MNGETIWHHLDAAAETPMDLLVNSVPPAIAVDFIKGCETIFTEIERYKPDVIVVPERGAGPIAWAVGEYERIHGCSFDKIYPLIGTHTDIVTNRLGGYNSTTKKEMINEELRLLLQRRDDVPVRKTLIFDEVQTGRTLSTATQHLAKSLADIHGCTRLKVIAAQDSRRNILQRKKVPPFVRMATNTYVNIPTTTILLPLFYVDRPHFLNYILQPSDADPMKQPQMLHTLQNVEAQKLIRNLVLATEYPDLLEIAIRSIILQEDLPQDQNETNTMITQHLYDWLVDFITATPHQKKPPERMIINWFLKMVDTIRKTNGTNGYDDTHNNADL